MFTIYCKIDNTTQETNFLENVLRRLSAEKHQTFIRHNGYYQKHTGQVISGSFYVEAVIKPSENV